MAELKTRPSASSVDVFIASIGDDACRADCVRVLELMRSATGDEPQMWGDSVVGFGTYHYRYATRREGDWFVTGFSPRKDGLTLYIIAGVDRFPELMSRLGKHKTGKSCLYIRRLADIDIDVLRELVNASVEHVRATWAMA